MTQPIHMRKGNNYSGNSFSATYADSVIGTILPYGGSTAPYGWFLCQGQAISRTDYSELFEVIGTSFGAGDGSTTFNLPDLRGEFLRGAGNNSHANQGNGGTVGTHQDSTKIPSIFYNPTDGTFQIGVTNSSGWSGIKEGDVNISPKYYGIYSSTHKVNDTTGSYTTVRPTNTSVNFIIKAKYSASPAGDVLGVQDIRDTLGETQIPSDLGTTVTGALSNIGNRFNYSTDEQVVGKWMGKPLYQITLRLQYPTVSTDGIGAVRNVDVSNLHIALGWVVQNVTEGSSASAGAWGDIGVQTVAKYYTRIGCNPPSNEIYLQTNRSTMSNIYVYTTIQYTKTTD